MFESWILRMSGVDEQTVLMSRVAELWAGISEKRVVLGKYIVEVEIHEPVPIIYRT